MNEQETAPSYTRHRFPPEAIGYAVRRYSRFVLR